MDLQQLLAAAQQMQDHLMSAQQELADAEVEGTSGGGLVKARVNGQGELVELTISPAAIDPADPADTAQTVADLVLAAVHNAYRAVADLQQEKMGPLAVHASLDQPAARGALDLGVSQFLLCAHEMVLHLLRGSEQLLQVHPTLWVHCASLGRIRGGAPTVP